MDAKQGGLLDIFGLRLHTSRFSCSLEILQPKLIQVRDLANLDLVAAEINRTAVEGLLVGQAPFYLSARTEIAAMATRLKLPAVYGFRQFAEASGLMSYGPSLIEMYRQSARLVGRILKVRRPAIYRSSCQPATS